MKCPCYFLATDQDTIVAERNDKDQLQVREGVLANNSSDVTKPVVSLQKLDILNISDNTHGSDDIIRTTVVPYQVLNTESTTAITAEDPPTRMFKKIYTSTR